MKTDMTLRMIGIVVLAIACVTSGTGCTINRNAPLLETNINVQDSANGNTVPLGGL